LGAARLDAGGPADRRNGRTLKDNLFKESMDRLGTASQLVLDFAEIRVIDCRRPQLVTGSGCS
jgi:hypothetical protein